MSQLDDVLPEAYETLRRLAHALMRGQRRDHTLQPTALVHDRSRFLALAARAMRQVLADHARGRNRAKRGGGELLRVTLAEGGLGSEPTVDWLAFDQALSRLEALAPDQVRLVELRYLGGLTLEETAAAVGSSLTSVKRDLAMARAWLHAEMER